MIDPARPRIMLPDPVPQHPLLVGRAEIGRGEYSIVLDHEDGERVYKIASSPADVFLLTAVDRPRGVHFPLVFADHGVIGRAGSGFPLHLFEMERLYPLRGNTPAASLAGRLTGLYRAACVQRSELGADMGRLALYHLAIEESALGASLTRALVALSDFVEAYGVLPDLLNDDNLMMRKDGTLVFADPVFIA
ncbi:hypothetical protein [Aromatoleum buckelii]|uniref:Aminoglycoside phosphotransferase domain-containing protein n=1 Tax=Aromatoleum buckelii TaxID=200254 RepID=A0ABX1MYC9_9RHOO|nr:hypothetical protein [Aromatoleum buckelii]MCK0512856.1 hypothetical protein [Aromatoleum buckelii]